jgi:hypothetical protein
MGKIAHARMSQMTRKPALVDLKMQGVQELIRLTNQQFRFWGDALAAGTSEEIRPGDLMDYWFILSALAQYPPEFRLNKKEAFSSIPNLKPETVRRYVADAGRLGFVETVKSKGKVYLQLTPAGQNAIANTLTEWIAGFSDIHRRFFGDR